MYCPAIFTIPGLKIWQPLAECWLSTEESAHSYSNLWTPSFKQMTISEMIWFPHVPTISFDSGPSSQTVCSMGSGWRLMQNSRWGETFSVTTNPWAFYPVVSQKEKSAEITDEVKQALDLWGMSELTGNAVRDFLLCLHWMSISSLMDLAVSYRGILNV